MFSDGHVELCIIGTYSSELYPEASSSAKTEHYCCLKKFCLNTLRDVYFHYFCSAACMTWDLAESGKDFVTTIVNRNDLVPSLGIASAAKLRTEVSLSQFIS